MKPKLDAVSILTINDVDIRQLFDDDPDYQIKDLTQEQLNDIAVLATEYILSDLGDEFWNMLNSNLRLAAIQLIDFEEQE